MNMASAIADPMEFRTLILCASHTKDAAKLNELRTSLGPRLQTYDTFESQVGDLIKTRHPGKKFSASELSRLVDEYCDGKSRELMGNWVYYPWSSKFVHLLDEAEFAELRTDRNRYKITSEEQITLSHKRIGVVGLSVGQAIAVTMALERSFAEIRLADFDTLELSNLNRIRTGVQNLGLPKAVVTAREIAEIDPYLKTDCYLDGLTEDNVDSFLLGDGSQRLDIVVEECDDLAIKVLVRQKARAYGIPVVMHTSDRGMLDIERFDREPARSIFHGLLGDVSHSELKGLSTKEKIPFVVKILNRLEEEPSPRLAASMIEIGTTISTWPQLASDVVMGGGIAGSTVRRILLEQHSASGRFLVCPEDIITDERAPEAVDVASAETPPKPFISDPAAPSGITDIIRAASRAPSAGNMQPWKWTFSDDRLAVELDTHRAPADAMTDFRQLASYAGLGASVENAVLKAHQLGFETEICAFPSGRDGKVASIRLSPLGSAKESCTDHEFDSLAHLIEERQTGRQPIDRRPLPPNFVDALRTSVERFGEGRLEVVTDEASLAELGSILGTSDRLRFLNQKLHSELVSELRFSAKEAEETRDGIDLRGLDLSPADRAGLVFCRRWEAMHVLAKIGAGEALEKPAQKILASSSLAGLIIAPDDSPRSYFRSGRALQRAWLTTTSFGLNFQPITSLPYFFARVYRGGGKGFDEGEIGEIHRLRQRYLKLFSVREAEGEVMLFVVNASPPPSVRSLRRDINDILSVGDAAGLVVE